MALGAAVAGLKSGAVAPHIDGGVAFRAGGALRQGRPALGRSAVHALVARQETGALQEVVVDDQLGGQGGGGGEAGHEDQGEGDRGDLHG